MQSKVTSSEIDEYFQLSSTNNNIQSLFVRRTISTILNESLNQLYILRHLNTRSFGTFDPYVVQYQTIQERITYTENHENTRLPTLGTNYDKIAHDVNIFINIIKEASFEIETNGTYNILKESIKNIKRMHKDDKELYDSKENNEQQIKLLQSQYEEEKIASIKVIAETNDKIQKVRFEVEDVTVYEKTESQFLKNYEASRREQNMTKCKIQEDKSNDVIKDINNKIELEQICHELFRDFTIEDRGDVEDLVELWKQKYQSEMDRRDKQLLTLSGELEYNTDTLDKLTKQYERQKLEIDKWNEYKQMKQDQEDRIKNEIMAIMRIQAWWRGTMTRRGIPPGGQKLPTLTIGTKKSRKSKKSKKSKKN